MFNVVCLLGWCETFQYGSIEKRAADQAWGQSTRYFGTLVLEYRFCSTRRYSVLVLLKSTCTRTCKNKSTFNEYLRVLYEY